MGSQLILDWLVSPNKSWFLVVETVPLENGEKGPRFDFELWKWGEVPGLNAWGAWSSGGSIGARSYCPATKDTGVFLNLCVGGDSRGLVLLVEVGSTLGCWRGFRRRCFPEEFKQ